MFSEDPSSLPPELDWDQMESGIMAKMEDLKDAPAPKNRLRRNVLIGIALAILLLIPFLCTRSPEGDNVIVNTVAKTDSGYSSESLNNSESKGQNSLNESDQLNRGNLFNDNNDDDNSVDQPGIAGSFNKEPNDSEQASVLNFNQDEPINVDIKRASKVDRKTGLGESVTSADINNEVSTEQVQGGKILKKIAVQENEKTLNDDRIANESDLDKNTLYGKIDLLLSGNDVGMLDYERERLTLRTINIHATEESNNPESEVEMKPSILIAGGVSVWDFGFGEDQPERGSFEQALLSYNAQIGYTHPLTNGFFLATGLSYQRLRSKFDWNEELEDYTVTLTDTVIEVRTNVLTRQSSKKIYGDIELTVPATRVVRHYNTTQIFQVPLAIGKSWRFGKWQTDLLLGASVNIISSNTGRTRYEGEISYYDGSSTPLIDNQWKWNALGAGRVTYMLGESLGITGGIQFEQSLSDWDPRDGFSMNPKMIQFKIGLSYQLK